jgi:spore germination cell wall hydrolase CwlJ-like protein
MFEAWVLCMAMAIHKEAASEPIDGQFMVAMSIWNRAGNDKGKVCAVVYKPAQYTGPEKRLPVKSEDTPAFRHAVKVAELSAWMGDFTGGVDHYHTLAVSPNWAYGRDPRLEINGMIGNHVTYKPKVKR